MRNFSSSQNYGKSKVQIGIYGFLRFKNANLQFYIIQFEIRYGNFRIQELNFWGFLGVTGQIRMTRNYVNSTRINLLLTLPYHLSPISVYYLSKCQLQAKIPKCTIYTIQVFCVVTFKLCACSALVAGLLFRGILAAAKSFWTLENLQEPDPLVAYT